MTCKKTNTPYFTMTALARCAARRSIGCGRPATGLCAHWTFMRSRQASVRMSISFSGHCTTSLQLETGSWAWMQTWPPGSTPAGVLLLDGCVGHYYGQLLPGCTTFGHAGVIDACTVTLDKSLFLLVRSIHSKVRIAPSKEVGGSLLA